MQDFCENVNFYSVSPILFMLVAYKALVISKWNLAKTQILIQFKYAEYCIAGNIRERFILAN